MATLLHELLAKSASEFPDRPAVFDRDRVLTYAQLDARANQLANLLASLGVERGDRVALYLPKSLDAVVGIYGVLKAGAVYVPQDPMAPVARVAYIMGNCGTAVAVTSLDKATAWSGLVEAGVPVTDVVVLDADAVTGVDGFPAGMRTHGAGAVDGAPAPAPDRRAIDLDLAYILYTSGSTGEPKGVKLTHLNAMTFVRWAAREFPIGPDDRLSSHAPLHFDLSVFDLFAAALAGASVSLVPPETSYFPIEVARFIADRRITVWYSVPSILSMLALRGGLADGQLPDLRTILFAGEVFPTVHLRRLMGLLPHVRFANLYGPTETNVCTWYDVPPLPADQVAPIPIGRAIDGVEVFAVTDEGTRAGPGEIGELYVRGTSVMQGYWADPERTARGLVAHPFATELADRCYRTGDLVRLGDDGNYDFLGRRDAQIKSRGYRIELGEIEAALHAHPLVAACAVVAVPDELATNRLKAFVVAKEPVEVSELARFCGERIPRYMVPDQWEFRDELAKTSTGKVDRRALAAESAPG